MKPTTTHYFYFITSKLLLVIIVLLAFTNGFSQSNYPLQFAYDHYGNKYPITNLLINTSSPTTIQRHSVLIPCDSGIFQLYYEDDCGMENTADANQNARRAIVCQVFKDISDFINTPLTNNGVKVKIQIRDITTTSIGTGATTSSVAALASSYYVIGDSVLPSVTGGIVDNLIFKTIASGIDPLSDAIANSSSSSAALSGLYHGYLSINFRNLNFNWNTNLSNTTPIDKDLYSIVLHEVSHALGIQSLINYNGQTILPDLSKNYYSRYDRALKTNSGIPLISTTSTSSATNSTMYGHSFTANTNTLYTNCSVTPPLYNGNSETYNCLQNIKYIGNASTTVIPVYTPNCFELSSSLSHFEDLCYGYTNNAYFVMSNGTNPGSVKRYYTPEERNVLCDIGYSVKTTFGTHFYTGATVCGGNRVVGIDDGLSNGQYTNVVTSGITSPAISFLNNDVSYNVTYTTNNPSDLAFEGLQDITAASTITITGNTFTFASIVTGFHVLRYVPYSISTGQRGNITYIYIYVRSDANCDVNPCNYVNNSGFESATSCGMILNGNLSCWYGYNGTGEFFSRNNCTNPVFTTGVSTLYNTTPIDTHSTNNNNLLLLYYGHRTVVCNRLNTSIVPTNTYRISYWARVGNSVSNHLNTMQSVPFEISLFPNSVSTAPIAPFSPLNGTNFNLYFPTSYMLCHSDIPNNNIWNFYSQTFTVPATAAVNLETIAVYAGANVYATCGIFLDDIAIRPIGQEGTLDLPPSLCSSASLTNLTTYLSDVPLPANGIFEGVGVSLNGSVYSFNPFGLTTGNYTVTYTYTNAIGCSITIADVITVYQATTTITGTTSVCMSNPVVHYLADVAGGIWSSSDTSIATIDANTGELSPQQAGVFDVIYTVNNGCSTSSSLHVTVYDHHNPPVFSFPTTICSGSVPPILPSISVNNISGIWGPDIINNIHTAVYEFKPNNGCNDLFFQQITVITQGNLVANSDSYFMTPSILPQTSPSILLNDTYNSNVINYNYLGLTITLIYTTNNITVNQDGTLNIPADLPVGTYIVRYQLENDCMHSDIQSVIITIMDTEVYAPKRTSIDECYSSDSYTTGASILDYVTVGGTELHANASNIVISNITAPTGFTINPDGTISVPAGAMPGSYHFSYTLCVPGNTTGCAIGIDCILQIGTTVRAIADTFTFQTTGAKVPSQSYNIFTNDLYSTDCFMEAPNNGVTVIGNVTLSYSDTSSFPGQISLYTASGSPVGEIHISSPPSWNTATSSWNNLLPIGIYPFTYTICDIHNPTICSTVSSWVEVLGFASKMTNATILNSEVDFNAIIIQPNPSSGLFYLTFNDFLQEKTVIEVYNLLSQKVLTDEIINTNNYELYLNNLSSGTYLLKIYDGTQSVVKKIIKQ